MAMSCEHSSTEYPAWLWMSIRYNGGACQRIQRIIQNKRINLQLIVCEVTIKWPRNFAAPYLIVPGIFYMSWWRHQMEIFSALLAFCAGNSPAPVISPHKGQWRGALVFSLICAWINSWANNGDAGDLRRHHAHYDDTVMWSIPALCILPLLTSRFAAKLGASGHRGHFSFE